MNITKKNNKYKKYLHSQKEDQGFGLVEATISLTTLGICLAAALPFFLYSKINNTKSEVRTGALMVAQRVLDDVRGTPFASISTTYNSSGDIVTTTDLTAMGRTYQARRFHCEPTADACTDNYKTLRVQVDYNGSTIYEMSAGFTNFR